MPLWGVADNDASEPKNLSTGEFQGTAGKAIFGVDNTEQGVVNGKTGDARKYAAPHAGWVGICLLYTSPSPRDTERSRMPSSA